MSQRIDMEKRKAHTAKLRAYQSINFPNVLPQRYGFFSDKMQAFMLFFCFIINPWYNGIILLPVVMNQQ